MYYLVLKPMASFRDRPARNSKHFCCFERSSLAMKTSTLRFPDEMSSLGQGVWRLRTADLRFDG